MLADYPFCSVGQVFFLMRNLKNRMLKRPDRFPLALEQDRVKPQDEVSMSEQRVAT